MRIIFVALLLIQFALPTSALALSCKLKTEEQCWKKLSEVYSETNQKYIAGFCNDNVYRLLYELNKEGFNKEEFVVLFIVPTNKNGMTNAYPNVHLFPPNSRGGIQDWKFHTILLVDSIIISDFDFTDDLQLADANTYFEMMFGKEKLPYVGIKSVPGPDYLGEYRSRGWEYYFYDSENRYPITKVE